MLSLFNVIEVEQNIIISRIPATLEQRKRCWTINRKTTATSIYLLWLDRCSILIKYNLLKMHLPRQFISVTTVMWPTLCCNCKCCHLLSISCPNSPSDLSIYLTLFPINYVDIQVCTCTIFKLYFGFQSLGLCTATVMFVLSQDRLNMDLDRESLELMLNLLESDVSHKWV